MSGSPQLPDWYEPRYFECEVEPYHREHMLPLEAESRAVVMAVAKERPHLLNDAVLFKREYEPGLSVALGASSPVSGELNVVLIPIDRDPAWMVSSGVHHTHCEWREGLETFFDYIDEQIVTLSLHSSDGGLILSMFFPAGDAYNLQALGYLASRFDRIPMQKSKPSRDTHTVRLRSFTGRFNADILPL